MIEISVDELRDDLRKYLQLVEQGDVLVITRAGQAIARILPVKADPSEDIKPAIITHWEAALTMETDSRESGSWVDLGSCESGKKGGVLR